MGPISYPWLMFGYKSWRYFLCIERHLLEKILPILTLFGYNSSLPLVLLVKWTENVCVFFMPWHLAATAARCVWRGITSPVQ